MYRRCPIPIYQYLCDSCGIEEEHFHSFTEENIDTHKCPKCDAKMRRLITGGSGIIFKGDDWPSKKFRQEDADSAIRTARRKAKHLKESGAVPWNEQITQKAAGPLHDKLESDMRKKEQERLESGKLAKEMDAAVKREK